MVHLVLVRHGQSEWNEKKPVHRMAGSGFDRKKAWMRRAPPALPWPRAISNLIWPIRRNCKERKKLWRFYWVSKAKTELETIENQALNERDYGDLAGLNKDDAREKWGEEQVHIWRRSFDTPPPGGESLKDTAERVLPYYETEIFAATKSW